jgi:hypothetical protein
LANAANFGTEGAPGGATGGIGPKDDEAGVDAVGGKGPATDAAFVAKGSLLHNGRVGGGIDGVLGTGTPTTTGGGALEDDADDDEQGMAWTGLRKAPMSMTKRMTQEASLHRACPILTTTGR